MNTSELIEFVGFVTKLLGEAPAVASREDDSFACCQWSCCLARPDMVFVSQDSDGDEWMTIIGYCVTNGHDYQTTHAIDAVASIHYEESAA